MKSPLALTFALSAILCAGSAMAADAENDQDMSGAEDSSLMQQTNSDADSAKKVEENTARNDSSRGRPVNK